MTRPARVVIDIPSLHHNLSRVRQLAPRSRIMAIVKAHAYGHGLVRVARELSGADAFGVACLEEAEQLRAAGVRQPVILLEGPYNGAELGRILELDLEVVIHHDSQVEMLEAARLAGQLRTWVKLDSGMHRLGFDPLDAVRAWRRLQQCPAVASPLRLMSHLARANEPEHPQTLRQLEVFHSTRRDLPGEWSLANSAGIIGWPDSHGDWVRPGLMLYGISPMEAGHSADHDLRPVMSLRSAVISVKTVRRGESVGYGGGWQCPADMTIGVVAAGYGDGYPRHACSGTPVLVDGMRTALVGTTSMDMLTVDLGPIGGARVGSTVELWGPELPIEEVARHAGTIPYELMCGVHKRLRVVEYGKS